MSGWTPERRRQQSELIRRWRPWDRSTGPRTTLGKAKVARNAYKGGIRPALCALSRACFVLTSDRTAKSPQVQIRGTFAPYCSYPTPDRSVLLTNSVVRSSDVLHSASLP